MARPRENPEPFSLFPFLSILTCVIGVLAIVIAIGRLDLNALISDEDHVRIEYARVVEEQTEARQACDDLRRLIKEAETMREEIVRMEANLAQQQAAKADSEAQARQTQALRERVADRRKLLDELRFRQASLIGKIDSLRQSASRMGTSANPAVQVMPAATGGVQDLRPVFVECTAAGLKVLPDGGRIAADEIGSSRRLNDLLSRIRSDAAGRTSLVFMLRPDGHDSWWAAVQRAHTAQVRYGTLPVPGTGPIDVSEFLLER